jgi:coenzyme F420 biosynthesis associated uncharacterized protein
MSWDARGGEDFLGGQRDGAGGAPRPSLASLIDADLAVRVSAALVDDGRLRAGTLEAAREDFERCSEPAFAAVADFTQLSGEAPKVDVVGHEGFVRQNLSLFAAAAGRIPLTGPLAVSGAGARVARVLGSVEMGAVLGIMAKRVLGQYKVALFAEEGADPSVLYVLPNFLRLEGAEGLPARQFRTWVALHEMTHALQFSGVPWLKGYLEDSIEGLSRALAEGPRDLKGVILSLQRLRKRDAGKKGTGAAEGGLPAALGVLGPDQRRHLESLQALMTVVEGHAEWVVSRVGPRLISCHDRFARLLARRRGSAPGPVRLLQRLIGIEAKLRQYSLGHRFFEQIGREDPEAPMLVFQDPGRLPSPRELRDPAEWLVRVKS